MEVGPVVGAVTVGMPSSAALVRRHSYHLQRRHGLFILLIGPLLASFISILFHASSLTVPSLFFSTHPLLRSINTPASLSLRESYRSESNFSLKDAWTLRFRHLTHYGSLSDWTEPYCYPILRTFPLCHFIRGALFS